VGGTDGGCIQEAWRTAGWRWATAVLFPDHHRQTPFLFNARSLAAATLAGVRAMAQAAL